MSEIIEGDPVMVPSWSRCAKCKSDEVIVEELGHYSETFQYGVIVGGNVEFAKLGPTITTCSKCGFEHEEDVN